MPSMSFPRRGQAASRASLHTDKCLKPTSTSCYKRVRRLLIRHILPFPYINSAESIIHSSRCWCSLAQVSNIMTPTTEGVLGFSGCTWRFNRWDLCAPFFFIYFGCSSALVNFLPVNLSSPSPEKHCKLNPQQILQHSFFIFVFFLFSIFVFWIASF